MGLFSGKFGLRRCRANRTLFEAPLDAIQEPVQAELEEVRELTAAKSGAIQSRFACCSELPRALLGRRVARSPRSRPRTASPCSRCRSLAHLCREDHSAGTFRQAPNCCRSTLVPLGTDFAFVGALLVSRARSSMLDASIRRRVGQVRGRRGIHRKRSPGRPGKGRSGSLSAQGSPPLLLNRGHRGRHRARIALADLPADSSAKLASITRCARVAICTNLLRPPRRNSRCGRVGCVVVSALASSVGIDV